MLIVGTELVLVEGELVGGLLGCPSCRGVLGPWGHARERVSALSLFDLNAGAIRSGAAAAPRLLGDQRQQTTGHVTAARAERRLCRVARALRLLLVLGGAVLAVSGVGE